MHINTLEFATWSVMLGGLLTIGTMALMDVLFSRSAAAWRGLVFTLVAGSNAVLLSGLPEFVFGALPPAPLLMLKVSLGSLSGAMVLVYLGKWMGTAAEDPLVHNTIVWGSFGQIFIAVVLTVLASMFAQTQGEEILLISAACNTLSVLLAMLVAVRAALLGDFTARSMVLACLLLTLSTAGLYSHALSPHAVDEMPQVLTAFSTVMFLLVMVGIGIRHNRKMRKLEQVAGLSPSHNATTGLPQGSVLMSKVEDVFWRSARLNSSCTVMCLHLHNLYQLNEEAGNSVEQKILSAMTARLRRAVGFRCVVGLHHPRCFVVVISAISQLRAGKDLSERLLALMSKPLEIEGINGVPHIFVPRFGIGSVTVHAADAVPVQVIDEAEQLALTQQREQQPLVTVPSALMG